MALLNPFQAALVCYICAGDLERLVSAWLQHRDVDSGPKVKKKYNVYFLVSNIHGAEMGHPLQALQDLVEVVMSLKAAVERFTGEVHLPKVLVISCCMFAGNCGLFFFTLDAVFFSLVERRPSPSPDPVCQPVGRTGSSLGRPHVPGEGSGDRRGRGGSRPAETEGVWRHWEGGGASASSGLQGLLPGKAATNEWK